MLLLRAASLLLLVFSLQRGLHICAHTFRAAVFQHVVPYYLWPGTPSRQEALDFMRPQLEVYRRAAEEAASQGARIIVFPEDGLYGPLFGDRQKIRPFLENLPIASQEPKITPCKDPAYELLQVFSSLSCIAQKYSVYVVANMGDFQLCNRTDSKCPNDGLYQFNTNVAFDPNGTFVARYHKQNLYGGEVNEFNYPPEVENSWFDTAFGRVGLATCFDILFEKPFLTLVEKYKIDHLAFPTLWWDVLPLLTAIQFHASVARGLGINVLAANGQSTVLGLQNMAHGSGLYTPTGAVAYVRDTWWDHNKLLVADVPVLPRAQSAASKRGRRTRITSNIQVKSRAVFNSTVFDDDYTFTELDISGGNHSRSNAVCQGRVCCEVNYTLSSLNANPAELYALGAFDGRHKKDGAYWLQVCVVLRCASREHNSCGSLTTSSHTVFSHLSLRAQSTTLYIYPQVTFDDVVIDDGNSWEYRSEEQRLCSTSVWDKPLLIATLLGRNYDQD